MVTPYLKSFFLMVAFTGVRILVSGTAIALFRNQKLRVFDQDGICCVFLIYYVS